jgi:aryl-alcohol dehydrogenase
VPFPVVGGHEGAGIVEKVGAQVDGIEVGDHVLLSFSVCGVCSTCHRGEKAYCFDAINQNFRCSRDDNSKSFHLEDEDVSSHFFGQSSFAQKSIVRGSSAVKVDKSLPLDILCPLACGVQTGAGTVMNVLQPLPGMSVAVFGAGAVGLCSIMASSISPASVIIAVDVADSRLDLARKLGATHVINPSKMDAVSEIRRITRGHGVDRAVDATGKVSVIKDMLACAAPNSIAATVGATSKGEVIEIEPLAWLQRGVSYRGVHQGSSDPRKVRMYLDTTSTVKS